MGERVEADATVVALSKGMRVEVYNARGTLRWRVTVDKPVVMVIGDKDEVGLKVTEQWREVGGRGEAHDHEDES